MILSEARLAVQMNDIEQQQTSGHVRFEVCVNSFCDLTGICKLVSFLKQLDKNIRINNSRLRVEVASML